MAHKTNCHSVTGAIILRLTYGYEVKNDDRDDLVDLVERSMEGWTIASVPGSFLVDSWPACKILFFSTLYS